MTSTGDLPAFNNRLQGLLNPAIDDEKVKKLKHHFLNDGKKCSFVNFYKKFNKKLEEQLALVQYDGIQYKLNVNLTNDDLIKYYDEDFILKPSGFQHLHEQNKKHYKRQYKSYLSGCNKVRDDKEKSLIKYAIETKSSWITINLNKGIFNTRYTPDSANYYTEVFTQLPLQITTANGKAIDGIYYISPKTPFSNTGTTNDANFTPNGVDSYDAIRSELTRPGLVFQTLQAGTYKLETSKAITLNFLMFGAGGNGGKLTRSTYSKNDHTYANTSGGGSGSSIQSFVNLLPKQYITVTVGYTVRDNSDQDDSKNGGKNYDYQITSINVYDENNSLTGYINCGGGSDGNSTKYAYDDTRTLPGGNGGILSNTSWNNAGTIIPSSPGGFAHFSKHSGSYGLAGGYQNESGNIQITDTQYYEIQIPNYDIDIKYSVPSGGGGGGGIPDTKGKATITYNTYENTTGNGNLGGVSSYGGGYGSYQITYSNSEISHVNGYMPGAGGGGAAKNDQNVQNGQKFREGSGADGAFILWYETDP